MVRMELCSTRTIGRSARRTMVYVCVRLRGVGVVPALDIGGGEGGSACVSDGEGAIACRKTAAEQKGCPRYHSRVECMAVFVMLIDDNMAKLGTPNMSAGSDE